jgi:hypothetical protein
MTLAAAFLLIAPTLATPAGASNPNAWVEYDRHVGDKVYIPMTANQVLPGGHLGCVGAVTLTFSNGMQLPTEGISLGGYCSGSAPCQPYDTARDVITSCTANPLTPVQQVEVLYQFSGDITQISIGCLRTIWVVSDANGDGVVDARSPPITVLGDCTP